MRLLIDPDGTIIDADRFTRRLRFLPNGVALLDYVVETIGFVWFETMALFGEIVEPTTEADISSRR